MKQENRNSPRKSPLNLLEPFAAARRHPTPRRHLRIDLALSAPPTPEEEAEADRDILRDRDLRELDPESLAQFGSLARVSAALGYPETGRGE